MHNEGLEYVINALAPSATIDQVIQFSALYLQKISQNTSSETMADYYAFIAESINRNESLQLDGMLAWLLQKELITEQGIEFIRSINNISDDVSLADVITKIESIENEILSSKLPVEQQAYPLLYAAVSKYSARYGASQESNSVSKMKDLNAARKLKWPWKKDGEGAISGAIGGAIGGIGGGVGGVLVGALLGAIGGGLGQSVASLFIKD
ncbi:hypothetical protein CMT34_17455 [Elizabethkingia anophelis]|nr:hypothetical protein [Elizabethkingia anophelis]MDV4069979.1 hypothetical protein [Elizabethkingia anophelis]